VLTGRLGAEDEVLAGTVEDAEDVSMETGVCGEIGRDRSDDGSGGGSSLGQGASSDTIKTK
jgi:hypothetical protein